MSSKKQSPTVNPVYIGPKKGSLHSLDFASALVQDVSAQCKALRALKKCASSRGHGDYKRMVSAGGGDLRHLDLRTSYPRVLPTLLNNFRQVDQIL